MTTDKPNDKLEILEGKINKAHIRLDLASCLVSILRKDVNKNKLILFVFSGLVALSGLIEILTKWYQW